MWDLSLQAGCRSHHLADHRPYDFFILSTFYRLHKQHWLAPASVSEPVAIQSELYGFFRLDVIGRFDEKIVLKPLFPGVAA